MRWGSLIGRPTSPWLHLPEISEFRHFNDPEEGLELPIGWYVAMLARDLPKKGTRALGLGLFGRSVAAWRDEAGRAVLMDGYCVHQGASLIGAKIQRRARGSDCLECPFHNWRFRNDGRCTHIPHSPKIPKAARQRLIPTAERYGYIWAWFGGEEPFFPVPEIPEWPASVSGSPNGYWCVRRSYVISCDTVVEQHTIWADDTRLISPPPISEIRNRSRFFADR